MPGRSTRNASKRRKRNVSQAPSINTPGAIDDMSNNVETTLGRKRKSSEFYPDCGKTIKQSKNDGHDVYCWKCHKTKVNEYCSKCPRAFHTLCFTKFAKLNEHNVCYVCKQLERINIRCETRLSDLLLQIFKVAMSKKRNSVDWPELATDERLFYKVEFRLIQDKCLEKGMRYNSPSELIDDAEWIYHNSIIVHGEKSANAKTAQEVLKDVKQELNDALDCPECYLKKCAGGPDFVNLCTPPHPLVWAKMRFFPYWPAKCLKVSNGKAHVRFFKTQQSSVIPIKDCKSMSEDYPSNKKPEDIGFLIAEQQQIAYIKLFAERYGDFPYAKKNEQSLTYNYEKAKDDIKSIMDEKLREEKSNKERAVLETKNLSELDSDDCESDDIQVVPSEVCYSAAVIEGDSEQFTPTIIGTSNNVGLFDGQKKVLEQVLYESCAVDNDLSESPVCTVDNVVSGRLLPSEMSSSGHLDNSWLSESFSEPSGSGISISNVISGTEVPDNNDLLEITRSVTLRSDFADRRNETSSLEEDDDGEVEFIMEKRCSDAVPDFNTFSQSIFREKNNRTCRMLRDMFQRLMSDFQSTITTIQRPDVIIEAQDQEIKNLKSQLDEIEEKRSIMKTNYEQTVKRLRNADVLLKSYKNDLNKQRHLYEQSETERKLAEENLQEARIKNFCSNLKCSKQAKQRCCIDDCKAIAYCSDTCRLEDWPVHKYVCKNDDQSSILDQPEESRENTSLEEHSFSSVKYTSIQHTTVHQIFVQSQVPDKDQPSEKERKAPFDVAKNCRSMNSTNLF